MLESPQNDRNIFKKNTFLIWKELRLLLKKTIK